MNKTLSLSLIVIAVLVLAGGVFLAGGMYAGANGYGPSMMFNTGRDYNQSYGPGMMNRNGGYGMMGGMMDGPDGYGWNNGTNPDAAPLSVDQAREAADRYIRSLNLSGLETGEVMIFDNNAYVVIKESGTGLGAFELLVDPASQVAYAEYGPNMMWNLKYGGMNHGQMMGRNGMMGGYNGMMNGWDFRATPSASISAEMTIASGQAVEYAQRYLDANFAGALAADDPVQFYGYYTLDFTRDGAIAGMLSVNGFNGQVFVHTWHGAFIEEAE